jgi:thiol-disulfide isomerase/thioredoxin
MRQANQADTALEIDKGSEKDSPLIFFFTALHCGPCKLVNKTLAKYEMSCPNARILIIDIDKEKELARDCKITQVPTLMFIGTHSDSSQPCLITQGGQVSVALIQDIVKTKLQFAGKIISSHRRL